MDFVVLKSCGKYVSPSLNNIFLSEDTNLKVFFEDGHTETGKVIFDFDRHGNVTPFFPVPFHGKFPWINLVGIKAQRI